MNAGKLSKVRRQQAPGANGAVQSGRSIDDLVAIALRHGASVKRDGTGIEAKIKAAKAQLRRG
jgi:hypothetical protein